ncbi:MAG: HAMP domain-containing protein [Proteobacteria bacterium]|nr:HAMP domain-containing protein [Pseudomonadota bacterium]
MNSLYGRIFLSFWAVMVLIVGGTAGLTYLVLAERGEDLPRGAAELTHEAARALAEGGEPGLREWLTHGPTHGPEVRVLVVDEEGRELLGRPLPPHVGRLLHAPRGGLPDVPGLEVVPARPLPQLVAPDGRHFGVLVLPPHRPFGLLSAVPEARIGVLLLALAVTGTASWLLTRSITRPVRALGAATRDLAGGNLDARVAAGVSGRGDELGTLARDFDAMAGRLRELVKAREQLLRDVSHELRSPLARMRVAVGLARQPGSDAGRELDRLETEIERLDRLIGQVLHLSRLDAAGRADLADDLDVAELVDAIARDAAFEAQGRGVTIDWQPPPAAARVRGHGDWLASAIENVVRNAVRYTAVGTAVEIRLEATAEAIVVRVRDRGPGVPAEELQRIFEPFHRVAESRTRESGGDGIGLAITARVFAAHRGSASARNATGGGLEVTLTLPAATA